MLRGEQTARLQMRESRRSRIDLDRGLIRALTPLQRVPREVIPSLVAECRTSSPRFRGTRVSAHPTVALRFTGSAHRSARKQSLPGRSISATIPIESQEAAWLGCRFGWLANRNATSLASALASSYRPALRSARSATSSPESDIVQNRAIWLGFSVRSSVNAVVKKASAADASPLSAAATARCAATRACCQSGGAAATCERSWSRDLESLISFSPNREKSARNAPRDWGTAAIAASVMIMRASSRRQARVTMRGGVP